MNFLLWLFLVSAVHSNPQGRRRESNRSPSSRNRKELSDEDILKALSILLSETDQDRPRSKSSRRGRQEFPPRQEVPNVKKLSDEFEFKPASEFDEDDLRDDGFVEADRQSFRGGIVPFSRQEKCEVTGFETRTREECEEAFEVECRPIKVKKIRTEIVEKCETLLDKKCDVSFTGVPKQQCSPKKSKRCEIDYNVVEEKLYKEECKVNVQHICEEHIKVPVPYPVKEPYHVHHDYHHPHGTHDDEYTHEKLAHDDQPSSYHSLSQPKEYYGTPAPLLAPLPAPLPAPLRAPLPAPLLAPLPAPPPPSLPSPITPLPYLDHPASLGGTLARQLFQRQKRTAESKEYTSMDVHGIVQQVLLEAIQRKEAIEDDMETKKETRKADPLDYPLSLPLLPYPAHSVLDHKLSSHHPEPELAIPPHHHHHHLPGFLHSPHPPSHFPDISNAGVKFPEIPRGADLRIPDFSFDELDSAFNTSEDRLGSNLTDSDNLLGGILTDPAHDLHADLPHSDHHFLLPPHHLHPDLPHGVHHTFPELPPGHPVPEHPPIVTTHEIPSEQGCRSLATKTCYKIPIVVPKKVPFETCREVPDVECVTVLKNVPEVNCTPEPYEECNDVAKDIPFLEDAEECEEIAYDDCVEVEERIPVELCKRKRVDEESIFLTRGQVFRKEGEKRRKKVGKRRPDQLNSGRDDDAEENQ